MSFDGLRLIVSIEDQVNSGQRIIITFETVLKFGWELEGVLPHYPNERSEILYVNEAKEYLLERADNDHPFLNDQIREFNLLLTDLGYLQVFARDAFVTKGNEKRK